MTDGAVGRPLNRRDGPLKVTGGAKYTAEIDLPNIAYAVVAQSAIANGRLLGIQTRDAEAAPGVLAVLTRFNMPRLAVAPAVLANDGKGGTAGQTFIPLQDDRIYHWGQHVAVVVAETLEQAQHAVSLIRTRYASEPPRVNLEDPSNELFTPAKIWGEEADTKTGFGREGMAGADVKIDQTYQTALQHHVTMEPHGTIAHWEGGTVTVYEPSTYVDGVQNTVSTWFTLPKENVRVIQRFVGGSFGCKGPSWPHVALAVAASRHVNRPVKLLLTREQTFTSVGRRPMIDHHIQFGGMRDGALTAVVHDALSETAPFNDWTHAPVTKTTRKLYACPNIETTYRMTHLNLNGTFTMRGPGETPGLFAVECAMDELAYALDMDPIALRLKNYAEVDPELHRPWSSKSLRKCYEEGAGRFGWEKRNPSPRSMTRDGRLIGWGMATQAYDAKAAPTTARVTLYADGHAVAQSATCDQGTGSYTTMAQIAADALGLSYDQVAFELGDTILPQAPISAGSMTTASVGSAVSTVAGDLRSKAVSLAIADMASPLHGAPDAEIGILNGRLFLKSAPDRGETYAQLLRRQGLSHLESTSQVKPQIDPDKYTRYSFGAHFAEVSVDPDLGDVRVTRYVAAFGAGKIINTKTAHSQLIGGIVWGIGQALMERTYLDERTGRYANCDLGEYHVPVNADIAGPIDAFFVEEDDPHVNLIGAKGIGEIGTIGCAPAIANAVFHATGKRIRDLPITPEKVMD